VALFLSLLLRDMYAISTTVLEQQSVEQRFRHPQAHFLNTRSMELLKHGLSAHVYQQIQAKMPPVHHWQNFSFGGRMDQAPLAVVRHPVDQPLQVGTDANGVLLEQDDVMNHNSQQTKGSSVLDLSPCSVGHLAQHTFGRILYNAAAVQNGNNNCTTTIRYNTRVETVELLDDHVQVTTSNNDVYETDLVVAADGAHSTVRQQLGIPRHGPAEQQQQQHLMNLHVRLSASAAQQLHTNNNYAMLYSVYSPATVAMVVCHTVGEYIIQIPYFPPYQTPEQDFGPDQLPTLLDAIFGTQAAAHVTVLSVQPWTMSSLVAQDYFSMSSNKSAAAVLVGDAAHVFPPPAASDSTRACRTRTIWRGKLRPIDDDKNHRPTMISNGCSNRTKTSDARLPNKTRPCRCATTGGS